MNLNKNNSQVVLLHTADEDVLHRSSSDTDCLNALNKQTTSNAHFSSGCEVNLLLSARKPPHSGLLLTLCPNKKLRGDFVFPNTASVNKLQRRFSGDLRGISSSMISL